MTNVEGFKLCQIVYVFATVRPEVFHNVITFASVNYQYEQLTSVLMVVEDPVLCMKITKRRIKVQHG